MSRCRALAVLAVLVALLAAPSGATAQGPCTGESRRAFAHGNGHDHGAIGAHALACRMREQAALSLSSELGARGDVLLGEMDVEGNLAAVAVTYPESGVVFFDVTDPARPRFLSWYRGSECDTTALDVNCGAFVDLSGDAKVAFLSVQTTSTLPGVRPPRSGARAVSTPGVEVIDVSEPARPALVQEYAILSEGGTHTARSHVIPEGPAGTGRREPGEYVFSIANGIGIDVSRLTRDSQGRPLGLERVNTIFTFEAHDTFIQNDPITDRTYLYVAAGFSSGFYVFDVTDPYVEEFVAIWDLTPDCFEDWYAHTIDVTHRGSKRYVTMPAESIDIGDQSDDQQAEGCGDTYGNGDRPGPLWIVDASDFGDLGQVDDDNDEIRRKSQAALLTTWTNAAGRAGGHLRFSPHNQQIVGDRIYLSHYHAGVLVLDAAGAFAGRKERPHELGFIVPTGAGSRPLPPGGGLAGDSFSDELGFRPSIWDMVAHNGSVLAADMSGGFYSLAYEPDVTARSLSLRLSYRARRVRGRRCATGPVRASLRGAGARSVRRVEFRVGSRRVGVDRRAPFRVRIPARRLPPRRRAVVRAIVVFDDGTRRTLRRAVRACAR